MGYDLKTNNRINYNFNLSIDWLTDKNDYRVNDLDFDENAFTKSFDWGNTVYFTLESQILIGLNTKNNLHFMIAPQINYRLFDDQGTSEFSGTNPINGYSFSLKTIDRNRIFRPSLALGLQ